MEWASELVGNIADLGVPIFLAAYLLAKILPLPSWPFTVTAGAWFGVVKGAAFAIVIITAGSTCAFLISRYFLKERIQALAKRHPRVKAVDKALRDGGWKAVFLLQMSPAVPLGLQNYVLGASKVSLRSYLLGTVLAETPSVAILTGIGAGARFVSGLDEEWKWAAFAAGLVATIALTWWIGRMAKRRLKLR